MGDSAQNGMGSCSMSLYDYEVAIEIDRQDFPFYALIMAAMRSSVAVSDTRTWSPPAGP